MSSRVFLQDNNTILSPPQSYIILLNPLKLIFTNYCVFLHELITHVIIIFHISLLLIHVNQTFFRLLPKFCLN